MEKFTKVHNRKGTRSVKWDMLPTVFETDDVLPMWVADMDFKAPQAVIDALVNRAEHGIFGYTIVDESVENATINWIDRQHDWKIENDWLTFSPGVIASLNAAVLAFTKPNDKILVQTPVYTPFYNIIEQHGRKIVKSSLVLKNNRYEIDFDDFENKLKQGVKMFVFCSPHNPGGRVWTKEELNEIARLCLKYDVLIVSDEIHSDIVFSNSRHIPIASLSDEVAEKTITLMSPTKTFNLAGLQASFIITKDDEKREKIETELNKQGSKMLNTLGITALEAAYSEGQQWLSELIDVLENHKKYVKDMLENHTNKLKVMPSEGTYLLWVDCSQLGMDATALNKFMIEHAKVGINQGISYGEEGAQFIRINIACPKETLEEGITQIVEAVNAH